MRKLQLKIRNDVGLHARPAAQFIQEVSKFQSIVRVRNSTTGKDWVNARSMIEVLTLGVEKDHEIELEIVGQDECAAADALQTLIQSNFA